MASDAIGGSITFSTAIDNSDLEKGLEDAKKKVDELKSKLESTEAKRNAIEEQMNEAQAAIEAASEATETLRTRLEFLQSIDISDMRWSAAQMEIQSLTDQLAQAEAEELKLAEPLEKLQQEWQDLDSQAKSYQSQLEGAEAKAESLSQRVSSFYYQAGQSMQSTISSVTNSISQLGTRLSRLVSSAMVFNVLRQGLNSVKNGIADALMQNQAFSASWTYLSSAMQGFANGIANAVAPMLVSVINGVTACVMTLARAIDSVFKTSLASSIADAQKSAQEAWRQTDESKAAQKQAEANAKAAAKQQEQYAKARESYEKQVQDAADRAAKAQEKLDKKKAEKESKYTEAVEDAAEKQAKAEQDAAEKRAEAEETAQERLAKAQEKAAQRQAKAEEKAAKRQEKAEASAQSRLEKAQRTAEERQASAEQSNADRQAAAEERLAKAQEDAAKRQEKAEATAAEKNAAAQESYEKKVAAAEAKEAAAKAKWDEKQAKAAKKLEDAQKKANASVMGFDELNKMNADSSEDAEQAMEDLGEYQSTLAEIEPPKTYTVDPADYFVDPADYAAKLKEIDPSDYYVNPDDYAIDPEDYAIDPSDYVVDPSDYEIDYDKYEIDPEDFFVDPEDYEFDPSEYVVDPEDYAVDPFSFDWTEYPEISAEEGLNPNWDAFDVGKIDEKMTAIMAIMGGALLAVGAILAFSGINIPLGIALMAVGALDLATVMGENWEKLPAEVQNAITNALVISGIVLIVVGAILAFSGVATPLGVGLMAAGFLLEWGAFALNWQSMEPEMQGAVTMLMGVLSGAFFVLGVILLLAAPDPGHKAIGLGLMVLGAAGMAASIVLMWDSLDPALQGAFTTLMLTVGTFAIVIGVVLLLAVPGMQALGVGLILTGVALLATAVALNWETLNETLRPALVTALQIVGAFAVVIGVVLLFVPGWLAVGIGLIIFGIAALGASEILADWESLGGQLAQKLGEILETIAYFMLIIGTILLFVPSQRHLGVGLIIGGIAVLAAAQFALNWESLGTDLAGTLGGIGEMIAKYMLVFGVILMFVPGQQAIGTGLIIGGIALLAVSEAALNWDSLGTDLVTTLGEIGVQIAVYMLVIGVILLFSPARALGIGLIVGGIALLAVSEAAIDWESTGGDLESALDTMAQVVATFMLIIGVILLFVPSVRAYGVGLIVGGIALFAVTAEELDWSSLDSGLSGALTALFGIIGPMMAVIGVIMLFASGGTAAPLSIGLIVGGIALFAISEVAENWEGTQDKVGAVLGALGKAVGAALFVIGVVMLLASGGTAAPIAIGLMVAGAAVFGITEEVVNWGFLQEKVAEVWAAIVDWWNGGPAQVFTAEWWVNLFKCIPEAIADAINGAIELVNSFIDNVSQALGDIVGATGGSFEGPSLVSNVRPPGLARGAVIPPNRSFMAVLGDQTHGNNIETPEALMRQVVADEAGKVMAEMMMTMQQQQGSTNSGGDAYMVLNLDGRELTRTIVENGADMARRGLLNSSISFA